MYNWGTDINFEADIYLKGSNSSLFILQTTDNVIAFSGARVMLVTDGTGNGKPKASNIVWQVAGSVDAGRKSHLEGVFLIKNHAAFRTGSSLNGRIFAQTACTLDAATITQPAGETAGDGRETAVSPRTSLPS